MIPALACASMAAIVLVRSWVGRRAAHLLTLALALAVVAWVALLPPI